MLKRLLSLLLIPVILFQSLDKVGIVAYYEWNKAYLAANVCVNRDKPKLHCDGKCYLAKKLKQAEQHEQKNLPATLKELKEVIMFCQPFVFHLPLRQQDIPKRMKEASFSYLLKPYAAPVVGFWHPPCV